ncbi:lipopolysaccharide biosynthesis protein [Flavitalea flava]
MSTIRRQSIISSAIVYLGFALGFLNTILLTREHGGFTASQYGLISLFGAIANIMYSFANLGMQAYIYKFYPYYKDNLPPEKNDMMTWALLNSILGFIGVICAGLIIKDLAIRKFGANSADLVRYYYWIFPFGLGLTLYSLLEAFAWQLKKSVLTTFLREVLFRVFITLLILLSLTGILAGFDTFIKIYAFSYLLLALIILTILVKTGQLHFSFSPSRVTKKFLSRIRTLALLVWSGSLVFTVSSFFAQIVIAAVVPNGLAFAGVYTLAQFIGSLMQAPQRVIIAASVGPLSQAWKDKDYVKINRIYHSSSINQLIFSVGMFVLIWINFTDAVLTVPLKREYLDAQYIFLFIGLTRIVDMGTGLNSHIIGTSTFWRFDFVTGMILLALTLPLNYFLAKEMGAIGPAIADLFSFGVYNATRYVFLYRKFGMQPFSQKSLYTLLLGVATYFICHAFFAGLSGYPGLFTRSIAFIGLFGGGVLALRLSDDIIPVWKTIKKRLGMKK